MRFDAPTIARAWLAVAAATGTDRNIPTTYKTIAIEQHLRGVRLVATDRSMLLTAYVPDLDHEYDSPPSDATLPERTIVASDINGRGRGLLGFVRSLAAQIPADDYAPGQIELRLDFDARMPADGDTQEPLEGMDTSAVVLSVPDRERVYLEVVPVTFPEWRNTVAKHVATPADEIALNPELLERLTKARKTAAGPLVITFGRDGGTALLEYGESDPRVHGALVPVRRDDDTAGGSEQPALVVVRSDGSIDDDVNEADNPAPGDPGDALAGETPELIRQAVDLVVSTQFGSTSMLKRKLAIGYERANRVMALLEQHGVVGPTDGRTARDVLVRPEQIDEVVESIVGDGS
jgi:hypothetical protein